MALTKTLSAVGNSLALIIDKPVLQLLDIDATTTLDVKSRDGKLIITPVRKKGRR